MKIKEILDEINLENGSNYKKEVLTKHKDNELLKRVLKLALDKVSYTFGVTMKNIKYIHEGAHVKGWTDLEEVLDDLEQNYCTRKVTGNEAIEHLIGLLESLSKEDAYVIERILDRDLKIRLGRTEVNKVFKNLIVKPPYQRCDIGTKQNVEKNINFKQKVYSQIKMDGTYRSCIKDNNTTFMSRPGNEDEFPLVEEQLKSFPDGYAYLGEMTVRFSHITYELGLKSLKKKKATEEVINNFKQMYLDGVEFMPRSIGNGIINSDNPPQDDVVYTIWDMIPLNEYNQKLGVTKYEDRLALLESLPFDNNVQLVKYRIVKSMEEAYKHFQELTKAGEEGTVIKAHDMVWKDGTGKKALKVKLVIELDMRITSFNEGNKGSKNEDYFSGINFENDEGTIKGTIGVTTMDEDTRDWFHANREDLIGQVIEIHCNDITQASTNTFHALSHPRYIALRGEKETDSLERALEIKQLAMEMK